MMSLHVTSRRCPSLTHASAVARAIRNLGESGSIYITSQNICAQAGRAERVQYETEMESRPLPAARWLAAPSETEALINIRDHAPSRCRVLSILGVARRHQGLLAEDSQ